MSPRPLTRPTIWPQPTGRRKRAPIVTEAMRGKGLLFPVIPGAASFVAHELKLSPHPADAGPMLDQFWGGVGSIVGRRWSKTAQKPGAMGVIASAFGG